MADVFEFADRDTTMSEDKFRELATVSFRRAEKANGLKLGPITCELRDDMWYASAKAAGKGE